MSLRRSGLFVADRLQSGAFGGLYRGLSPPRVAKMGNHDSLVGISLDSDSNYGIVFLVKNILPVLQVNVLVGVYPVFAGKPINWRMDFQSRGRTNGKDYAYQADISDWQFRALLSSEFISFTALYQTKHGMGHIGFGNLVNFTDVGLNTLRRCVSTLH